MKLISLIIALTLSVTPMGATASERTDSASITYSTTGEKFRPTQLILPGALVAVGAAGVAWGDFHKLNRAVRDGMSDLRGSHYFRADDYFQYINPAIYLGLGAIPGVPCRHNFKERFLAEATAYLTMGILTNAIKYTVRERRPDTEMRNSFPSGHTAMAFTGAELIRQSYPAGVAAGAYTVAIGVAFLRLYNNRHWLNDVIAGAGIGILSARVGMWMLPLYRKWFRLQPRSATAIAMLPYYNPANHSAGIGFSMAF